MNKSITTPKEPLTITKVRWFCRQLKSWASGNLRNFPWRKTQDPYAILVAEFLLQKTNADTVAPVYQRFMERYPNLSALAAAPEEDVTMLLQPLGLAFRADRLRLSTQLILKNYKGKIPKTEAQLLKLPGVGKYTARSICAHAFGQRKTVLDTNVARILERFFGFCGGRVKWRSQELQEAAEQAAPKTNVGTVEFGAAGLCSGSLHR